MKGEQGESLGSGKDPVHNRRRLLLKYQVRSQSMGTGVGSRASFSGLRLISFHSETGQGQSEGREEAAGRKQWAVRTREALARQEQH